MRLFLVRHGETQWNLERRIMGKEPVSLNETGKKQSQCLAQNLETLVFQQIYTSPIVRAQETARVLNQEHGLTILEDSRLEEVDYGDWVGMTFKEARATPGYVPYFQRLNDPVAPQGESLSQVQTRALDFLNYLKTKYSQQTVLAVSHADWIKCLVLGVLQSSLENIWRLRIDNASISVVECDDFGDRMICINQRGDFARLMVARPTF